MHITATQIDGWARTKEAQSDLPRLIRRLVLPVGTPTQAAFPAGDSTSLPGWDGELQSDQGGPWIPNGKSFWEFSCDTKVTTKANSDYKKRTDQTPKNVRAKATLIVVSARRWAQKGKWLKAKRLLKKWADIRAYDADDLEQWLEQNSPVALQFAEELGLIGPGVESISKHWADWSKQVDTPITQEAFFVDRQETRDRFLSHLKQRLESGQAETYTIRSDSVDEAAAFACTALLTSTQFSLTSLVVTDVNGWRYVEQNPSIKIALAARPEFAAKPTRRNGLVVVIPYEAGHMAGYYKGSAGRETKPDLTIDRPRIYEFGKALTALGIDEANSNRLAVTTGRSWSVFRRRYATNPAIRKPAWLDVPQARALSTLCLLGGWSAESSVDRDTVGQLAGRSYEDIERDLRHLVQLDDAPVLKIGEIWKARSPLELLDLFGHRITRDELDRFFQIVRSIFATPDPELDLPDDERHAAQIHGKVRPQSRLLIEALSDTLIKLAVRGPQVPALESANIQARISALVSDLLNDADGTRWLSLSSLLPDLAEAAPDAFMKAVEESLIKPDQPVTRLLTETSGSGMLNRCWHSGLLWALERLAWAPDHLARVSLILARLSHTKIKGNWANSPKGSLVDIFRSWYPQTAADLNQRMQVLRMLTAKEPDAAFDLLDTLVYLGSDHASPSSRPSWRDDDMHAGYGVTGNERREMLIAAADLMIASSKDNPRRVATLIKKIMNTFDPPRINATLALADDFTSPSTSDADKEVIRAALRECIHWYRNFEKVRGKALDEKVKPLEELYEKLLPTDLVIRHRWLFAGWPKLPSPVRGEGFHARGQLVDTWRVNALRELHSQYGMSGIEQLTNAGGSEPFEIGLALAKLNLGVTELSEWISNVGNFEPKEPLTLAISGLLHGSPHSKDLIQSVLQKGQKQEWDIAKMARFLITARGERTTWDIVASYGAEVESAYWFTVRPFWLRGNDTNLDFALRRLLTASRPRTALYVCHFNFDEVEAKLLAEMLERMLQGQEPDGPRIDSYHLGEAIDRLEKSAALDNDRLVRLEFGLLPALGYEGEQHAKSLYNTLMSDPKLFTQILCLVYKAANAKHESPPSEIDKLAAQVAWRVLHGCKRQPGTQSDGTIDHVKFIKFVKEAMELCREVDRFDICQIQIGEIVAHAPTGADGVWPFEPAREILDRPDFQSMRRGFVVGVRNKRGVTSRSPEDGGGLERALAEDYRRHARALQNSHPNLAAALENIVTSYENDGRHEDLRANLRREGH